MSIRNDVKEMKELVTEMKRLSKTMKILRQQKQQCENRIIEYLRINNQPGLKLDGMTIIAADKTRRKYEGRAHKLERGARLLQQLGISNSKEVIADLLDAMKGDAHSETTLKIL